MKKIIVAMLACCAFIQIRAADLNWLTSLPQGEAQAKTENKLVLMVFTGSDWCPACILLNKEVFDQPQFADYAKTNLVLVEVDFPQNKPQSDALKTMNAALAKKYDAEGLFPTVIALKPDGTVVWIQAGYAPGGPAAMIAQLDKARTN